MKSKYQLSFVRIIVGFGRRSEFGRLGKDGLWRCSLAEKSSENLTLLFEESWLAVGTPEKDRDLGRVTRLEAQVCFFVSSCASSREGSELLSCLSKGTCNVIDDFFLEAPSPCGSEASLLDKWPSCSLLMLWKIRVKAWSISLSYLLRRFEEQPSMFWDRWWWSFMILLAFVAEKGSPFPVTSVALATKCRIELNGVFVDTLG